ncbi:MAG: efflux RND transporter periplasmic adaptor subunit [Chloroflexi bacterium]|nr:efflux RND transporter periplasmic adaptor subunit [Chloroflexota bacterium]
MSSMLRNSIVSLMLIGFVLAACGAGASPAATSQAPAVVTDNLSVIAEGRLLPRQYVKLSFRAGGEVAELLAAEGDRVEADQVIARLKDEEQLQAQIAQADTELLNAGQALDELTRTADVARASAELAVANAKQGVWDAERNLKSVTYPKIEDYQKKLSDALDALTIAQNGDTVNVIGPTGAAIQGVQDSVETLRENLGNVQTAEQSCQNCDPKRLNTAQDNLNGALNSLTTLELQQQNAALQQAQAIRDAEDAVEKAQDHLEAAMQGPNDRELGIAAAKLKVAQATLDDAKKQLDKVKDGPDVDKLAAARARLSTAEASLAAAREAASRLELHAPFAGTITTLGLKVGEQVSPGAPIVTLADFSGWVVETDNLTEIDVVKIKQGQGATTVLDALPDVKLRGNVTSIASQFEEKRGDITYTVKIELADADPLMRWGMTAEVTFEK